MGFRDPVVAENELIREAIRSANYAPGSTGWRIGADGTAEFTGVTINVSGTSSGLQVVRSSDGFLVGSFDEQGHLSCRSLSVADDDVSVAGTQLSDILASQAASILAYGIDISTTDSTTSEKGVFEVAFVAPESKYYQIAISGWLAGPSGTDAFISLRDGGSSQPSISSTRIMWAGHGCTNSGIGEQFSAYAPVYLSAGQHRLLYSFGNYAGTSGTVYVTAGPTQPSLLQIMDTPAGLANVAVANTGGGGSSIPVQTYSTTWQATWSRTYDGSGNYESYLGNTAYQGSYDGSSGHNRRSMIGFDYASIQAALSGASLLGCGLRLYAKSWYWNAGGTAVIGSHNASSAPATFSGTVNRLQSAGWPNPGLRWIDLMGIGLPWELQAGTSKGIVLGPGPSNDPLYYGAFAGAGMDWDPQINITYQK